MSSANNIQEEHDENSLTPTDQNVLKRHVQFFDRNNDGIIYPWETFQGFRAIGCGIALSAFSAVFINMGLSRKTRPGKIFSLLFPIEIQHITKAKHGSDSGVYDGDGRFVPLKFEEIFKKYARKNPDTLTSDELSKMIKENRESKDYAGWLGAYVEWKILFYLCKDRHGLLRKETVRGVYDGTLFEHMERETLAAKKKK